MKEDIGKNDKERQALLADIQFYERKEKSEQREREFEAETAQQELKALQEELSRQRSTNKELNDHISRSMEQIMKLQREAQETQYKSEEDRMSKNEALRTLKSDLTKAFS